MGEGKSQKEKEIGGGRGWKRETVGEGEQKEKRGKEAGRAEEKEQSHRDEVRAQETGAHVEHKRPALQQQGLEDGLWRSPDICLQVRTTASPRADSRQTTSLRPGL